MNSANVEFDLSVKERNISRFSQSRRLREITPEVHKRTEGPSQEFRRPKV